MRRWTSNSFCVGSVAYLSVGLNIYYVAVARKGYVRTWWDRLACCMTASVRRDTETQTYDNAAADISSDDGNNNDGIKDVSSDEIRDPKFDPGQTLEMQGRRQQRRHARLRSVTFRHLDCYLS
jgi:hypothetical protein